MRKKKRRLSNWLSNLFLLLLLLIGLALIFNNQIKNYFIKQTGEAYAVGTIDRIDVEKNMEAEATFDFDAVEPASSEAVLRAQLSNKALPVIGGVAVPSVGINLPIFKGLANEALLYGAGTLSPTQKMGEGNYALASHRAQSPELLFTPLDDVAIGAAIYVTDLENIYTYTATSSVRVDPTDVYLLDEVEGRKMITLITCGEMGGVTRRVIQGDLESVTPVDEATDEMLAAFNMAQRTF
ncbi:class A sortase [Enterococcus casseliflavus]|uniref:class A sortase n=1 Tax=Enterococcus casseliflavus TaxID=37734 RepID=UPI001432F036|nr:class A sortase [Enterococcus casseliflavus]MDO7871854.1 class A sortase [Enterococcus casseliflavus]NKD33732.1 class A sortase [Enterococcus casseliflavus]